MTILLPKNVYKKILIVIIFSLIMCLFSCTKVSAEDNITNIEGKIIVVDGEDSNYSLENSSISLNDIRPNGKLQLKGDIKTISHNGKFISYIVSGDNISFSYLCDNTLLNAEKNEWHIYEDSKKEVNGIKLDNKIKNGALIVQTSVDGNNWIDSIRETNIFEAAKDSNLSQYLCSKIELDNGTYYRVLIAYETEIVAEQGNFLFVKYDKPQYRRTLECYEFYIADENTIKEESNKSIRYLTNIDSVVNTGSDNNGYSGSNQITLDDPHYGWELGRFYISGFSGKVNENSDNPVFLKNVGDEIALKFNLKEDIKKLNDKDSLYINSDGEGYDAAMKTKPSKNGFGKGALIVKYTDYNGDTKDPVIYTNFLEANASLNADTTISLYEEGEYEVALDYEIRFDKRKVPVVNWSIFPEINHYRVFFKFTIGNANCMVYPFDAVTGSELTNNSVTKNGFTLDLARSHSLDIKIEKQVLKETEDDLIPDTRFNTQVQEGEKYTDDGIYIITVKNKYTNTETTKTIYVGDNPYLTMYMYEGKSLEEIKEALQNKNSEVQDDGTIVVYEDNDEIKIETQSQEKNNTSLYIAIGIVSACTVAIAYFVLKSKKNTKKQEINKSVEQQEIEHSVYEEIDYNFGQNNNEENNDEKDN